MHPITNLQSSSPKRRQSTRDHLLRHPSFILTVPPKQHFCTPFSPKNNGKDNPSWESFEDFECKKLAGYWETKKRIDKKYMEWYRDLLSLHKEISHGNIHDLKGVEIDLWQEKTEEFIVEYRQIKQKDYEYCRNNKQTVIF